MRQTYVDMSQLNQRFHNALPLTGLGNSIFAGGSVLGTALGQEEETGTGTRVAYPWMEESSDTEALQQAINAKLAAAGKPPIEVDGVLGPETCGAARRVGISPPGTCQSFGGGTTPTKTTTTTTTTPASRRSRKAGMGNYLIIGAAVLAIGVGAYALAKRKRRGRR